MNSRERFTKAMNLEQTDRPPLFDDGVREEVINLWRKHGLDNNINFDTIFNYDKREELEPNLEPIPTPDYWPKTKRGLQTLISRLDPDDPSRLSVDWEKMVRDWKSRDFPLILRVHRGFFLTLGVHGWKRFSDAIELLVDNPGLVERWMNLHAEFSARLVARILDDVDADAVLFSEPIGGNHGPLISPQMYASIVLKSYKPILEVLKNRGVTTIIFRTYANTRVLLPAVVKAGFNCLWACECEPKAMDYREIRKEFGKELRLIGGIDSDCLRQSQIEIKRVFQDIVSPLLEDGGYIPLADGRVREDVTYENYRYYRSQLDAFANRLIK